MIRSCIPDEFARQMRSVFCCEKYKGVEHRFFLHYCGVIIFKKVLDQERYKHFLNLSIACTWLRGENATNFCNEASKKLKTFVDDAPKHYGPHFTTINVHNLTHIHDDVQNMQSWMI